MMMENQIPLNSHKLINFNVPNYLITNFDELVKFKRISRTSMLIRLMESYVRNEVGRLKEDDKINHLIRDVKLRNHIPPKKLNKVKSVEVDEDDILPPPLFQNDDDIDWESRLNDLR